MVLVCASLHAGQLNLPSVLTATGKKTDYLTFRSVSSNFAFEYPKRDWHAAPGYGSSLVTFVHSKGEAAVSIEHVSLKVPYAPEDIAEAFLQETLNALQEARTDAQGFESQFRDSPDGRIMVIEFTQDGARSKERVRLYALPRGLDLYRVVCTATTTSFSRYDTTFEYMAASLKAVAAASS
jgi:hypothetical protein